MDTEKTVEKATEEQSETVSEKISRLQSELEKAVQAEGELFSKLQSVKDTKQRIIGALQILEEIKNGT